MSPNDVAIFYFAGHGTQTIDLNGDEADGLDESLCLYDINPTSPGTWFTDDVLEQLIAQIPTQNVFVLVDAGYTGTGSRNSQPQFVQSKGIPLGFSQRRLLGLNSDTGLKLNTTNFNFLAADGGASEISPEQFRRLGLSESKYQGLLTYAFCEVIEENPDLTFGEIEPVLSRLMNDLTVKLRQSINFRSARQTAHFDFDFRSDKIRDFLRAENLSPKPQERRRIPRSQVDLSGSEELVTSGEINLDLKTNKRVFREGENLVVSLKADRDCYVRIYYVNLEGEMLQIFPNQADQKNFIQTGMEVSIPGAGDSFSFTMTEPFGCELLVARAATEQFSDLLDQKWASNFFYVVEEPSLRSLSTRGIRVTVGNDAATGEAILVYEVRPDD